jgi:hypothetical protein
MDLLQALTEDMVHEVIWTERPLGERERVIVREQHRSAASASAITAAVREYFADPDTYLRDLLAEVPGEVVATLVRLADEKRRPPRTPEDLADALAKAGVPGFAEDLRTRLRRR